MADLLEVAIVSAVGGDELGHDGHGLFSVIDCELRAGTVEILVPKLPRLEGASIAIASAQRGCNGIESTATGASARRLTTVDARMSGVSLCVFVGLPNVEFGTTGAVFSRCQSN